jgi:hypothetical protein
MPATWLSFSCAAWFAEFVPEPANVRSPGFAFAIFTRSAKVLIGLFSSTTIASGV